MDEDIKKERKPNKNQEYSVYVEFDPNGVNFQEIMEKIIVQKLKKI